MKQLPVVQGVAGGCTKVRNPLAGVDGNRSHYSNQRNDNRLQQTTLVSGAESGAVGAENGSIDPDLAHVMETWSTLPPAIHAAILAMIDAADTTAAE